MSATETETELEGRSVDDRVEAGEDEEQSRPVAPMKIPLPGFTDEISTDPGGTPPTSAEMRLLGGLMPLEGEFAKGDEVLLIVRARVTHVEFADVTDDWGEITRTIRRHKSRMIEVRRAGDG